MSLPGFRISKVSIPIYISNDGSFFYPKLFPVSLLYYCIVYVNLIKDRSFLTPSVLRESGCKGKEYLAYPPNFCGTFFEVFFGAELRSVLPKSGCKGKEFVSNRQTFREVFFRSFFRRLPGEGPSAWASLAKGGTVAANRPERTAPNVSATFCQASPLPFRKRVQKYGLFPYSQNLRKLFFELFRRVLRKLLVYRYVTKHNFSMLVEAGKRRHTL